MNHECARCGSDKSVSWFNMTISTGAFFAADCDYFELCDRCTKDFWDYLREGSQIAEDRRIKENKE